MLLEYDTRLMPMSFECQNFHFCRKYGEKTLKFYGFLSFRAWILEMAGWICIIFGMQSEYDEMIPLT